MNVMTLSLSGAEPVRGLKFAGRRLAADRRGQDLVEYALLAGFIAVAAGAIFPATVAPDISTIFSKVVSTFGRVS
jgi:Flp pilus assembly pilin Flp